MFSDLEIFLSKHKHLLPPAHHCPTSGKELASSERSRSWKATSAPSFEDLHWTEMIGSEASWQEGTPSRCPPPLLARSYGLENQTTHELPQHVPNPCWSVWETSGSSKLAPGGFLPFSLSAPSSFGPGKLENFWTNVVGSPERNKTSCELGCGGGGTLQTDVVLFLFQTGKATSVPHRSKAILKSNTRLHSAGRLEIHTPCSLSLRAGV